MDKFTALFGLNRSLIKKTCLLMPLLPKGILAGFGINKLANGRLYNTGQAEGFTLINTRVGSSFVGDAVLYLKDTPCENVILYGSCGLVRKVKGLGVGSLVVPDRCYSQESFSQLLLGGNKRPRSFFPDKALLESFLEFSSGIDIRKAICSTLGSLKLEEGMAGYFVDHNIEIVDMECSAMLAAADSIGLRAMALFYVSDIIKQEPFYFPLKPGSQQKIESSLKNSAKAICDFTQKRLPV